MTIFDRPADVIAALQADAGLARRVDMLVRQRFNLAPKKYRELFWLVLAEASCAGARVALDELQKDATKREQT